MCHLVTSTCFLSLALSLSQWWQRKCILKSSGTTQSTKFICLGKNLFLRCAPTSVLSLKWRLRKDKRIAFFAYLTAQGVPTATLLESRALGALEQGHLHTVVLIRSRSAFEERHGIQLILPEARGGRTFSFLFFLFLPAPITAGNDSAVLAETSAAATLEVTIVYKDWWHSRVLCYLDNPADFSETWLGLRRCVGVGGGLDVNRLRIKEFITLR